MWPEIREQRKFISFFLGKDFLSEHRIKDQIADIMAGRDPLPPKDFTPRTPPSGGNSGGGSPVVQPEPATTAA
jgi:hypothetical protein